MRLKKTIRHAGDFIEVKRCRRRMTSPSSILFPVLWVTSKCNLKCKMCDQWKDEMHYADELSAEEWFKVIDSAGNLRAAVILITGGEPLLRPDIFDILRYISKKNIASHLCTNGTLLNEYTADKLISSGLNAISVSLDSNIPAVYNNIRGADVFEQVTGGIRALRRRNPGLKIGINCLISRLNFRDIHKMVPFAESLGIDQIKFDTIHTHLMHRRRSLIDAEEVLFTENDLPELSEEVQKLLKALAKSRLLTNSHTFIKGIIHAYKGKLCRTPCFAGYISCSIDSSGKVAPCDNTEGMESVREKTLEAIWGSPKFRQLRNHVHSCSSMCWDSTHAEINLRCSGWGILKEFKQIARELCFYC